MTKNEQNPGDTVPSVQYAEIFSRCQGCLDWIKNLGLNDGRKVVEMNATEIFKIKSEEMNAPEQKLTRHEDQSECSQFALI